MGFLLKALLIDVGNAVEKGQHEFFADLLEKTGRVSLKKGEQLVIRLPSELAEAWLLWEKRGLHICEHFKKDEHWSSVRVERIPDKNGQEYVVIFEA